MFNEDKNLSKQYKQLYLSGLEHLIAVREDIYKEKRCEYIKEIFTKPGKYRNDFKKMLGYPLVGYERNDITKVKSEKLSDEGTHSIFRMSFEILDNVWMTGLLFKKGDEKRPMVLVQHGGLGTPELVSGFYGGDTSNYNNMLKRVIQYDVNAFAPQTLLWDKDVYKVDFNRAETDARLKRVGSSIAAVEIFGLTRIIDWFEMQDYVKNFGMVGLSYGGFFSLFTTAIDTRIQSAISCSYFNDRTKIGWTDWTWNNAAEKFFDAEIACLIYPRQLCIEIGGKDELFIAENAEKEWERLKTLCKEVGTDWVKFIKFDGCHEFCKSDEPIKQLTDNLLKGEKNA